MTRYPYFRPEPCIDGTPAPKALSFSVERVVRFDEVDMMTVLWHGHYAGYFEDARVALGDHFGIGYHQLIANRVMAPVRQMFVDYRSPLAFAERCRVTATLHWHEGARINMSYRIATLDDKTVATGYSVQMFIDEHREVMLEAPEFHRQFCQRWKAGTLSDSGQ